MENTILKPVVWVANPDDKKFIEEYNNTNEYKSLVDSVITPMDVAELQKQGYTFPSENIDNSIFCIDPCGGRKYISRTAETDKSAIVWRIKKLKLILQLLGGKNFKVVNEISCASEIDKETKVNAEGQYKGYGGKVGVDTSNDETGAVAEKASGTSEWKGQYNLEDYKRAVRIAQETGLDRDPIIYSFLEARNPTSLNSLQRDTYKYEACSDLQSAREVCVDIKAKARDLFSLDVNVDTSCNESVRNNEIFEYEIEFGEFVGDKPTHIEISDSRKPHSSNKWFIILIIVLLIALVFTLLFLK